MSPMLFARRKLIAISMAGMSVLALSACGGGGRSTTPTSPKPAQPKTFVYVGNAVMGHNSANGDILTGAGGISEFQMAANGTLTRLLSSPLSFSTNVPTALAADPQGRFVFAASPNNIFTFSITTSAGALTQVASIALPSLPGALFTAGKPMLVDHAGNFLYAATQTELSVFSIGASGALTSVQTVTSTFACPDSNGLALDAAGRFLYVSACGPAPNANIMAFSVNSTTGMLTVVSAAAAGPFGNSGGIAVTPAGNFVYVESATPPQNSVYASNNGTLIFQGTENISTIDDFNGGFMVMQPSGKFLYETISNSLGGMSIGTNGALTQISPFMGFPLGPNIGALAIGLDPTGNFVLVAETIAPGNGTVSGSFAVLAVDANTGNLTQVPGTQVALDVASAAPGAPVAVSVPQP